MLHLLFSSLFDFSAEDSMIHIVKDDDFISKRLSSGKYVNIQKEDRFFSYTVDSYKSVRCAYIMCAYKNYRNNYKCLVDGIKYILSNEKIDIIMFNGTLNLKQFLLFKVPKCLEPKILPLTIGFMDKRYKEEYSGLLEGKNWDYSLINLDVR